MACTSRSTQGRVDAASRVEKEEGGDGQHHAHANQNQRQHNEYKQ